MNVRLSEIFTSIEGEGILYGTKTLFIRLAGCPFECFYCDTPDSLPMNSGTSYDIGEACMMIEDALKPNTYKVNFTGGDPLVQSEAVRRMAEFVQSKGMQTYLESSCYDVGRFSSVIEFVDFVKIEFKTRDSEFVDPLHHPRLLQNALGCLKQSIDLDKNTYIKIVVSARTGRDDFGELLDPIFRAISDKKISGFIIQPTYGVEEPSLGQLLELYDMVYPRYSEVRIIPQLHKIIGAP